MNRRIPITFRHLASGDEIQTTIPPRIAALDPDRIMRSHRLDPELFHIVGRGKLVRGIDLTKRVTGTIGIDLTKRVTGTIGIITQAAWPDCIGGGELVWRTLAERMQCHGFDVHIFSWARVTYGEGKLVPVASTETANIGGVSQHYVPRATVASYVAEWAKAAHPTALWASFGWELGLNLGITTLSGAAPLAVYQQFWQGIDTDTFSIPDSSVLLPEWDNIFDAPDMLVSNSPYAAGRWGVVTGRDVPIITPPTADALGSSTRDGAVIMVGHAYEKGIDLFQRVADQMPEREFVIIGNAEERHSDNCRSVGWADPRTYYESASALLAPSFVCETYGMAVEEARKWGVPTIVSDNGALRDHCELALPTSDLGAWVRATEDACAGRLSVEAPTRSRRDALREFDTVARSLRMTRKGDPMEPRTFPTIATYSGVKHTSVAYLNHALIDTFGLTDYPGGDVPQQVKNVMLHSWSDGQPDMFARLLALGKHPYAVLHSPAAQGELDGEDSVFEQVLQLGPSHVLCGHAPMAKALGCRWLPVPIRMEPLEKLRRGPRAQSDTIRVGMWNTWSRRKNTWTQMLAMRELARMTGRPVELHGPVVPDGLNTTIAGSVLLLQTTFAPQHDYYSQMGGMDLNLQVTHAESYNYTAMESFLLGVPCLVGPCTPAGRFGMEGSFVVDDPTDPIQIAQMALKAIEDSEEPWFHKRMVDSATDLVTYRHLALKDTLLAIERGDV